MSIALVITSGFGNGTFNGSVADVTTRGYTIGEDPPIWAVQVNVANSWSDIDDETTSWSDQANETTTWAVKN